MTELKEKPFAPACERNQQAILDVLKKHLRSSDQHVFEIGSGTGQHAVYIAKHLTNIMWQTSDVVENHSGISMWLKEAQLENVLPPLEYEIGEDKFPGINIDVVFSANTLHIISETLVEQLIKDLGTSLKSSARVMFYGPFKYRGEFTSESNADFDLWLKDIDPLRGVRDFEWINQLMQNQAFKMIQDINMPANNQLLLFEKK